MAIPNKEVLEVLNLPAQNIRRTMNAVGVTDSETFLKGRNRYFKPSGVKKLLGYRGISFSRKIITFANLKGGVGKTTVCLSIAHRLSDLGAKVLIIDLDKQANSTSNLLNEDTLPEKVFYHVIDEESDKHCDIKNTLCHIKEGLDLIPSSLLNSQIEAVISRKRAFRSETYLKKVLKKLPEYDYILIDTEPSLSQVNSLAILGSDQLIIPITLDRFAIEGLTMTLDTVNLIRRQWEDFDIKTDVLINKFDGRIKSSLDYLSTLNDLGVDILKSVIRTDINFQKSQGSNTPLTSGNGYDDIASLAYEVMEISQERAEVQ